MNDFPQAAGPAALARDPGQARQQLAPVNGEPSRKDPRS